MKINAKPKESFKFVKIKLLKELNSYIEYFDPTLSNEEVYKITNALIKDSLM